jgi:predicted nucleotidyltransferase
MKEVDLVHPLIEAHLDAIRALCREFGVSKLELFGSATTNAFDPDRSDVDFIVHYPDGYDTGPWAGRHFELQERLESVLGRPVDLVMASAMRKPRFIEAVDLTRQDVYAA